jgi:hypothetical protein
MADTSIPVTPVPTSLDAAAQAEAVAPNSLSGWTAFQREVNTGIPSALREVDRILTNVDRVLGG